MLDRTHSTRTADTARERRIISRRRLRLLRPLLRYSGSRDAYVLRGVGHRVGPVLQDEIMAARSER